MMIILCNFEDKWGIKQKLNDLIFKQFNWYLSGAFYPYYYKTHTRTSEDDIMRTLSCKNPLTTIAVIKKFT